MMDLSHRGPVVSVPGLTVDCEPSLPKEKLALPM